MEARQGEGACRNEVRAEDVGKKGNHWRRESEWVQGVKCELSCKSFKSPCEPLLGCKLSIQL